MKTNIRNIQRVIDKLQEIVDEAENRKVTKVNVMQILRICLMTVNFDDDMRHVIIMMMTCRN